MLKIQRVDYFYTPRDCVVAVSRSIGLFQETALFCVSYSGPLSADFLKSVFRFVSSASNFPLCSCSNLEPKHGTDSARIARLTTNRHRMILEWPKDSCHSHTGEAEGSYTKMQLIVSAENTLKKLVYITVKEPSISLNLSLRRSNVLRPTRIK